MISLSTDQREPTLRRCILHSVCLKRTCSQLSRTVLEWHCAGRLHGAGRGASHCGSTRYPPATTSAVQYVATTERCATSATQATPTTPANFNSFLSEAFPGQFQRRESGESRETGPPHPCALDRPSVRLPGVGFFITPLDTSTWCTPAKRILLVTLLQHLYLRDWLVKRRGAQADLLLQLRPSMCCFARCPTPDGEG